MPMRTPEDAMPWVGLYVCAASLVCTIAMAADAFHGFRQGRLWFPCKYFTLNAASITLIAIAMKLPVDLTTIKPYGNDVRPNSGDLNVKIASVYFLVTMLANFLPSLGLMDDKELLFNIIALGILIITIFVNLCIEIATGVFYVENIFFMLPLLSAFSVALTVPVSRSILEHQYNELHKLASNYQEISFSYKKLVHNVKKYWMMAETGNPQFVIASSQVSSAIGVICLFISLLSSGVLVTQLHIPSYYSYGHSDYKWSIKVIINIQLVGVLVGSIAPTFRCLTAISYFNLSKKGTLNHLNLFRVDGCWTHMLQQCKRSHNHSRIPGRHCKIVFHTIKNMILNLFIALQITFVVICTIISLIPKSFLIVLCCCWYFCKSSWKSLKKESNVSTRDDLKTELKKYSRYVLQIEDEVKLSNKILRNALKSITRLLHASEEKESSNLWLLLHKSTAFNGLIEFDNDQVPPLNSEEPHKSWSLVAVTLTAIMVALPNTASNNVEGLLAGMREGLQFVRQIEESINTNNDSVQARKAASHVWTEIELHRTWLQIDLQKKAHKGNTSKEILQWLGDEAVKIVIQFKSCKKPSLDNSIQKFVVANSMYRISQTILLHYDEQENGSNDEELFEWIISIIADLLSACFTNLPQVITMKCHHNAVQKREDSIQSASRLLGKSKKILKMLKAHQLPNLDMNSMACIEKWHALPESQTARVQQHQLASSSSSESLIVTIM